jgi:3'-5' exoribonuclease
MMVRIAEEVAKDHYGLDKDLLKTGCLVHDIGKMVCYHWDVAIEMSDIGRLLHHTVTGYQMLMGIADELKIPQSDLTLIKLGHIIANHHEDEGIKNTEFPEAVAVGLIDNLNAQVNFTIGYCSKEENRDPNSNWTKYCHLTSRQYFVPRVEPSKIDLTPVLEGIE